MSEKESIAVSVIIPVHNAAGYISDTLSTVLSQTLNDIEIIIVNDCSDDNTLEIVSALAETDSRIRVINNTTNLGGGGSRNIGLDAATGEYVIFLDDDDYADNMMLERMYARASDIQADVVICRSQSFDPALQVYAPMPWSVRQELLPDLKFFSSRDIPSDFFRTFVWWPWDKLLRRQFITSHQLRFQEIRTTNDLFFVCAFMLMANRISVLNETLISHTINRSESLSATRAESHRCAVEALVALKAFICQQGMMEHRLRDYKNYVVVFLEWHLNTISGPAFHPFYQQVKEFVVALDAKSDDFYDEFIAAAHHRITTLSAEEYLFSLKDRVLKELEFFQARSSALQQEVETLTHSFAGQKDENAILHNQLHEIEERVTEQEQNIRQLTDKNNDMHHEMTIKQQEFNEIYQHHKNLISSLSWKLTKPLRVVRRFFK